MSLVDGGAKSREMAGRASADENELPVAEPADEKDEPSAKWNGLWWYPVKLGSEGGDMLVENDFMPDSPPPPLLSLPLLLMWPLPLGSEGAAKAKSVGELEDECESVMADIDDEPEKGLNDESVSVSVDVPERKLARGVCVRSASPETMVLPSASRKNLSNDSRTSSSAAVGLSVLYLALDLPRLERCRTLTDQETRRRLVCFGYSRWYGGKGGVRV